MRQNITQHDHEPPLVTPTDTYSGMPWVIAPPNYPLPNRRSDLADDNHAFHPAKSPLLDTMAGQALRHSRLQRVDWYDHHMVYHKHFYGPDLPTDEAEIFRRVVFAVARYIPDMALNCNDYEPRAVRLTHEEKARLWQTNELRVARPIIVRNFLASYVTRQDLSHISEHLIDEFLYSPDKKRQWYLGHWLLSQAAQVATEPINDMYRDAVKRGSVAPNLTSKTQNLVKRAIGDGRQTKLYVQMLHEKLAA